MKLITVKAVANPVVQMLASFGLAAVMYMAIKDVLEKGLTVGEFTSFLAALLMVTAPLRRLVSVIGPLQQGIAAGQSVFEVLDAASEDKGGDLALERARGDVEFRDVSFTYDKEKGQVLAGNQFSCRPRGDGRNRRPLGQRQVDAGEPAAAIPRPGFRGGPAGRHRHSPVPAAGPAQPARDGEPGRDAGGRHHRQQHRVQRGRCGCRNRAACRESRARAGIRRGVAAGTRDADRRSRHAAVRRAAPARRDRTRDPEGCAGADPGRGDFGARRRVRAPRADRARRAPEEAGPRSSLRTGFPRSRARIASSSWTRVASSNPARMPRSSRWAAPTPRCTGCSSTSERENGTHGQAPARLGGDDLVWRHPSRPLAAPFRLAVRRRIAPAALRYTRAASSGATGHAALS